MLTLTRRAVFAAAALLSFPALADDKPTNTLALKTKYGVTMIKLRPDLAPNHVKQIQALVSQKFYDGIVFHRVIPGFMAQTGDPTGTGTGGSKLPNVGAEFNPQPFQRGTLGMARASDPDSANSQFFICLDQASFLNGKYTVFGEVTSGMEFIDKLKAGTQENNGKVDHPDKIITLRFAPDAQ
jgi:peptidylprolyl isomerase